MKYFTILIMLFTIMLPLTAQESSNIIQMKDFDKSMDGFSFAQGGLVKLSQESEGFPPEIDFIFDMPSGLGMNNSELTEWFPGKTEIIDMGEISLDTETQVPTEGFTPFLGPEDIIPGHTYLIRTANTEYYGKINVVQFDEENELIEFTWVFLVE